MNSIVLLWHCFLCVSLSVLSEQPLSLSSVRGNHLPEIMAERTKTIHWNIKRNKIQNQSIIYISLSNKECAQLKKKKKTSVIGN